MDEISSPALLQRIRDCGPRQSGRLLEITHARRTGRRIGICLWTTDREGRSVRTHPSSIYKAAQDFYTRQLRQRKPRLHGDPRAKYVLIDDQNVSIRYVDYDLEKAVEDL